MTTKFLDDKVCTFKILLSWRFPRKQAFLDDFPLCPQSPPPLKSEHFIFIVVSPSLNSQPPEHSRIPSPSVRLGTPLFSEVVPERASQSCCHGIPSSTEGISDNRYHNPRRPRPTGAVIHEVSALLKWATPEPSHNKPYDPHFLSWPKTLGPFFLSEGF